VTETETAPSTTFTDIARRVSAALDDLMASAPLSQARAVDAADADQVAIACTALAKYALGLASIAAPAAEASVQELLDKAIDRLGPLGVDVQPLAEQLARHLATDRREGLV